MKGVGDQHFGSSVSFVITLCQMEAIGDIYIVQPDFKKESQMYIFILEKGFESETDSKLGKCVKYKSQRYY